MPDALGLAGARVQHLTVGPQLIITFSDDSSLTLEQAFQFDVNGHGATLDAGSPSTLGPVLQLVDVSVRADRMHSDGTLEVEFSGGQRLVARPSQMYESWTFTSATLTTGSAPGGGLL